MSIEIDDASLDLRAESISRLKTVFPQLLTEGRVDFARVKDLLAGGLAGADHYELTWASKAAARRKFRSRPPPPSPPTSTPGRTPWPPRTSSSRARIWKS